MYAVHKRTVASLRFIFSVFVVLLSLKTAMVFAAGTPTVTGIYACPTTQFVTGGCFNIEQGVKPNEFIVISYANVLGGDEGSIRAVFDETSDYLSDVYTVPATRPANGKAAFALPESVYSKNGAHTVSFRFSGTSSENKQLFNFSVINEATLPGPSNTTDGNQLPTGVDLPKASLDATAGGSVMDGLKKIADQFTAKGELAQSRTVGELIVAVINTLLTLLFAIVVVMVIYGGFTYVTAAGADDKAKKGRKIVTQALIGMAIVILAYVLVSTISNALDGNI